MGQVIRRCLNCVTAITGPLLFSLLPSLPYLVAGGVTAMWTVLLWFVIKGKMAKYDMIIIDAIKEVEQEEDNKDAVCDSLHETSNTWEVMARRLHPWASIRTAPRADSRQHWMAGRTSEFVKKQKPLLR